MTDDNNARLQGEKAARNTNVMSRRRVQRWRGDDGVIDTESMQIHRPHENTRVTFSDVSTLRPGFKKLTGSTWTIGHNEAAHVSLHSAAERPADGRAGAADELWDDSLSDG